GPRRFGTAVPARHRRLRPAGGLGRPRHVRAADLFRRGAAPTRQPAGCTRRAGTFREAGAILRARVARFPALHADRAGQGVHGHGAQRRRCGTAATAAGATGAARARRFAVGAGKLRERPGRAGRGGAGAGRCGPGHAQLQRGAGADGHVGAAGTARCLGSHAGRPWRGGPARRASRAGGAVAGAADGLQPREQGRTRVPWRGRCGAAGCQAAPGAQRHGPGGSHGNRAGVRDAVPGIVPWPGSGRCGSRFVIDAVSRCAADGRRAGDRRNRSEALNDTVEVTRLLRDAQAGDPVALNEALRQMYDALHGIARAQLGNEQMERTLSATALVNEAYLKVFGGTQAPDWANRRHLLGVAARAMREVLVDSARRRNAAKRPREADRLQITEISMELSDGVDYSALVECLDMLATLDRRQADIVAMRFFMGMSAEQIAMALEISTSTVQREWRLARAWLQRELAG